MITMTRLSPPRLAALADQLYRKVQNDPHYLLAQDSGGLPDVADAYIARLIDLDDEIVAEWLIERPVRELHRAAEPPVGLLDAPVTDPSMRQYTYTLQNHYAVAKVSADPEWADIFGKPPPTFQYRVAALRYTRRMS